MRDFESNRMKRCQGSPTVKLMNRGKEMKRRGEDVLLFTIGEPNFNCPDAVKQAAIEAIEKNMTRYTPAAGTMEVRERIARKLLEENGITVDPATDIIVTPSGKLAFFQAAMAFLDEGDDAMLLEPTWMTYNDIVRMTGANCVSVPLSIENNFVVTRELLEQYVTGKTKMLILCNPSNPTGHVMSKEEVEAVADFALAHDILVVSDEIYERLIFDGRRHYSIGTIERVKDRVITLNGLSKSHAMMGFRFGYSAAPAELTRAMMKMQESTVTTASSISQYAAITAYDCKDYVEYMRGEYQKRRDYLYEGLNAIPCVTCPKPEGTFYMFFKADYKGMNAFELADYMLKEAHILAVPGEVYGAGGEKCIRFSFAASLEDIQEAVRRLQRIFAK